MNVALVGLTTREEVALGMLVGKSLPGWQCSAAAAGFDVPLPPADLYVVDLAGRGMRRWTEEAQSDLLKALDGAPAVLVAPAFDQTWSALDSHLMKSQSLVLLHKPYGTEDMRAALKQAAAGCARLVQPQSLPVAPSAPRGGLSPASAPRALPVIAAMPPSFPVALEENRAAASGLQGHPGVFPWHEPPLFMRMLGEALALHKPFEVRVSFLNRMIFHPDAQWMASNTPVPVLEHLCQNDALASSIEIDTIGDKDAMARAMRLDMPIEPLESFLSKLAHEQLNGKA